MLAGSIIRRLILVCRRFRAETVCPRLTRQPGDHRKLCAYSEFFGDIRVLDIRRREPDACVGIFRFWRRSVLQSRDDRGQKSVLSITSQSARSDRNLVAADESAPIGGWDLPMSQWISFETNSSARIRRYVSRQGGFQRIQVGWLRHRKPPADKCLKPHSSRCFLLLTLSLLGYFERILSKYFSGRTTRFVHLHWRMFFSSIDDNNSNGSETVKSI